MNVVDSLGWLEYFADADNADFFAAAIEDTAQLAVPTISLYEVFKRVLIQRGEDAALRAIAIMVQAQLVELDTRLALDAAYLSVEHRLPMADSIILATARSLGATLWTQDADFTGLPDVMYRAKS